MCLLPKWLLWRTALTWMYKFRCVDRGGSNEEIQFISLHTHTLDNYYRWGQGSRPTTHLWKPAKAALPPGNVWLMTAEGKKATALINTLRVWELAVLGGMCQIMFGFGPVTCDSVKDSSRQLVENGLLSFFKTQHIIPHWLACQILHKVMSQGRFKSSSNCQLDCIALYQWD